MSALAVTDRGGGTVRFNVRVQPRSSRSGVDGLYGEALKVRVTAPPVEGAANEAVVEVLAEALGVPRRMVRIVAGDAARNKVVEVDGVSAEAVRALGD